MNTELATIHALLDRLQRRQRVLATVTGLLQGGTVVLAVLLVGGVALSLGAPVRFTMGIVGLVGLLGIGVAALGPVLGAWGVRGPGALKENRRRQARLVEVALPGLRSRLITTVDRAEFLVEDEPSLARALLARAAGSARESVADLAPATIHPAEPVKGRALGFLLALGLAMVGQKMLPVGPVDVVRVALGGSLAAARLDGAEVVAASDRVLVGDIVLRYVYPDYTGLDPIEVPNSDGTIHAPPGTNVQITARSERSFDGAAIQLDEDPPVDAALSGGRTVSTTLQVRGDGTWRLLFFRGDEVHLSPDFEIVTEADAPPVVALQRTRRDEVPVDQSLGIGWSVRDDYGIVSVLLEVRREGSDEIQEVELRRPLDPPRSLDGGIRLTPRELGLHPGETVWLRVVARDNDLLEGSKRGESAEAELDVVGPLGGGRRLARYHQALRDTMLPVLADFLEERVPPARSPEGMTRWAANARLRFEPIDEIVEDQWGDETPEGIDGTLVRRVLDSAARLLRFTVTAFEPGTVRRITSQDRATFGLLHEETVEDLEQAIWVLDAMLRQTALKRVIQQAQTLAWEARELAEMAPDADAAELLARVDQLGRLMERLSNAANGLADGSLREFLNSRVEDAARVLDEIRKAIAEGRMEDARAMLDQLAAQLEEMAEGFADQMAGGEEGEDQLRQAVDQWMESAASLEADQGALANELAGARERLGEGVEQVMALWTRLDTLAKESVAGGEAALGAAGDGAGWRVGTLRRLEHLDTVTREAQDAVRARDPRRAADRVAEAILPQDMARRMIGMEAERARPPGEAVPEGLLEADAAVAVVGARLQEMARLLSQVEAAGAEESPELQQAARDMASRQDELRARQEDLEQQLDVIEQALPTSDGAAGQAMQSAGEDMGKATEDLSAGRAMPAEGRQRSAENQVEQAQRALERAMGEYEQMQQAMRRMQGEDDGGGDRSGRQDDSAGEQRVEIPAPEDFQTPEDYRRALLEGMAADVPEAYRALKKHYYEELVRQ